MRHCSSIDFRRTNDPGDSAAVITTSFNLLDRAVISICKKGRSSIRSFSATTHIPNKTPAKHTPGQDKREFKISVLVRQPENVFFPFNCIVANSSNSFVSVSLTQPLKITLSGTARTKGKYKNVTKKSELFSSNSSRRYLY